MDDSWITLANWVTAVAVVGSVLAVVISARERRADAWRSSAVSARPELLDVKQARALLDRREVFLRRRTPPEVESLELLDDNGHLKRYEGLYVLYLGPGQVTSSTPEES